MPTPPDVPDAGAASPHYPVYILQAHDPWIIVAVAGRLLHEIARVACQSIPAPVTILCQLWWSVERNPRSIASQYRSLGAEFPNLALHYLCNTIYEQTLLTEFGVPAIHCNHNAFLNEDVFDIRPSEEKRYDAIYNAALSSYKRHHLCARIRSLALIAYRDVASQQYIDEIRALLQHADWVNRAGTEFHWLREWEVCQFLNQSRVGLCLSRQEGAMFASTEYLLCGLPVVSTHSLGGRDEFFHEDYVAIVDDCPEEVANAVARLCRESPDRNAIRSRTIARLEAHRRRFSELVRQIGGRVRGTSLWDDGQHAAWPHRLVQWLELSRFEEQIQSCPRRS
jgi:glycosyltransferase involved in cell wall biosynthesis